MRIKDLIAELEALYNTYDDEYKEVMGEPGISLDVFRLKYPGSPNYDRYYAGISTIIQIDKYPRNWYEPVINAFAEPYDKAYDKTKEGQKRIGSACPWPQSWEA
jgi:hypothetical protein